MDDFQYSPLDKGGPCFRLLRLLKGDKVEVECEIFHSLIPEHNEIPYEALSYTWGSSELLECIKLNGKKLWITENLHSALQCLRYHEKDRLLWIDAICIDQFNLEERSGQVQKMGMIYGLAKRVIFWLGKPTAEAALLLQCLNELYMKSASVEHAGDMFWKVLWSEIPQAFKAGDRDSVSPQRICRGLQLLLKRPWFRRVWILQEVAKAQSAVVCAGRFSVPAHIFALAPLLLDLNIDAHVQSILDIMPGPSRTSSWWDQKRDLFNLLNRFHGCEATDMRDMFFALLGISSDPPDHELLRADYTKAFTQIVHNTVRYWFEETSISINWTLDYLSNFSNLHAIYLVPRQKIEDMNEHPIGLGLSSDHLRKNSFVTKSGSGSNDETVKCIRDAALLLLEQRDSKTSRSEGSLHSEFDNVRSILSANPFRKLSPGGYYLGSIEIGAWKNNQRNVNILTVSDISHALLMVGNLGLSQLFRFVADHSTTNRQRTLNEVLFWAAGKGYERAVEMSLDEGADPNHIYPEEQFGQNALCSAADRGHTGIVQTLLDRKADVNAVDSERGNALCLASYSGHKDIVEILLDKDADVKAQVEVRMGNYGNALCAAIMNGNKEIVQLLLDKGADVKAEGGEYGNALSTASCNEASTIAQLLLDKGADVNAQGGKYGNALCAASSDGNDLAVRVLLENGADGDLPGKYFDWPGKYFDWDDEARNGVPATALEIAQRRGYERVSRLLLQYGAKPGQLQTDMKQAESSERERD